MKLVSQTELAALWGVTTRTVRNWETKGLKPREIDGRKRLFAIPDTVRFASQPLSEAHTAHEDLDLNYESARHKKAQADLAELELTKARGDVVQIELVRQVVADDYKRVRARLLAIPAKLAAPIASMENIIDIEETIDGAVNAALAELSADERDDYTSGYTAQNDSDGETADTDSTAENDSI